MSASSHDICLRVDQDNLLANEEAWLDQKAKQHFRDDPSDFHLNPEWNNPRLEMWFRELQRRRAAWCWHQNEDESMALWDRYAHQGVAIRSDLESISRALGLADDWNFLPVNWLTRIPIIGIRIILKAAETASCACRDHSCSRAQTTNTNKKFDWY